MKNTITLTIILLLSGLFIFAREAFAQGKKDTKELIGCVCQAGVDLKGKQLTDKPFTCLEELKENFFKDNKYSDFADLLKKGLCPENKSLSAPEGYYLALTRYNQLKYLEDSKSWDEYFANGNDYRDDIVNGTQKAIAGSGATDPLSIYARLLLYKFHKDQQDNFVEPSLEELMVAVSDYAKSNNNPKIIKETGDVLFSYDEKGKSKELYRLYAQKISASDISDEALKGIALDFYKNGNVELSENIYDIYIARISKTYPKDKLIKELSGIAKDFAYKDGALTDAFYAEKTFKKIEEVGGKDAFDEGLMYLRGYNLEKSKLYAQAKDIYLEFLKKFTKSAHNQELTFKIGIIYTYISRDAKTGRTYFMQLSDKGNSSPYSAGSLYQLGLLKQWEGDYQAAKDYYNKLLDNFKDLDPDRIDLAKNRLKEIEEGKPIDYNLKVFLDITLKSENTNLDTGKLEVKASSYQPEKGAEITVGSSAFIGATGCMQVDLQYLWSGDLGGSKPSASQSEIKVSYKAAGTQVINAVLVSPSGVSGYSIDLIDVH